eukprot:173614_1
MPSMSSKGMRLHTHLSRVGLLTHRRCFVAPTKGMPASQTIVRAMDGTQKVKKRKVKASPSASSVEMQRKEREIGERYARFVEWARDFAPREETRTDSEMEECERITEIHRKAQEVRDSQLKALLATRAARRKAALDALPMRLRVIASVTRPGDSEPLYPMRVMPASERPLLPEALAKRKMLWNLELDATE